MMLHQDGSRHLWVPVLGRQVDLIATLDDATSELYSAFLVEEEGTASTFRALHAVIAAKGLFSSLYTDRGSHYFHPTRAGGKVDRDHPPHVGRARTEPGIRPPAASPQGAPGPCGGLETARGAQMGTRGRDRLFDAAAGDNKNNEGIEENN